MIAKPEAFGLIQLVIGSRLAVQLIGSERFCCARAIAQSGVVVVVVVIKTSNDRAAELLALYYNITDWGMLSNKKCCFDILLTFGYKPRSSRSGATREKLRLLTAIVMLSILLSIVM